MYVYSISGILSQLYVLESTFHEYLMSNFHIVQRLRKLQFIKSNPKIYLHQVLL